MLNPEVVLNFLAEGAVNITAEATSCMRFPSGVHVPF